MNCTSNCTVFGICLSNYKPLQCLAWDSATTTEIALTALGVAVQIGVIVWKFISNRSGQSTQENEGVYKGKHEKPSLVHTCLASAPSTTDTNNRAYLTGNCFGNPNASWMASGDGPTAYDYYNVHALQENRLYQLVTLSTRQGAYVYTKDEAGGIWSTWSWYQLGTCVTNC